MLDGKPQDSLLVSKKVAGVVFSKCTMGVVFSKHRFSGL